MALLIMEHSMGVPTLGQAQMGMAVVHMGRTKLITGLDGPGRTLGVLKGQVIRRLEICVIRILWGFVNRSRVVFLLKRKLPVTPMRGVGAPVFAYHAPSPIAFVYITRLN